MQTTTHRREDYTTLPPPPIIVGTHLLFNGDLVRISYTSTGQVSSVLKVRRHGDRTAFQVAKQARDSSGCSACYWLTTPTAVSTNSHIPVSIFLSCYTDGRRLRRIWRRKQAMPVCGLPLSTTGAHPPATPTRQQGCHCRRLDETNKGTHMGTGLVRQDDLNDFPPPHTCSSTYLPCLPHRRCETRRAISFCFHSRHRV